MSKIDLREWVKKAENAGPLCDAVQDLLEQGAGEAVAEVQWAAGIEGGIREVVFLDSVCPPVGTKLYASPQAAQPARVVDDSELDDMAWSAFESAMAFGVNVEAFKRLARDVRKKLSTPPAAPTPSQAGAVTELETTLADACATMIEWDAREKDHSIVFSARMELCNLAFEKARTAFAAFEAKKAGGVS